VDPVVPADTRQVAWENSREALGVSRAECHWIMLAIVQAALQGIYQTAVYDYAANGTVPSVFSADLIAQAYVPKSR
jgi:hypothetical protein